MNRNLAEFLIKNNFKIVREGEWIFYVCKRCGCRFVSEKDALSHLNVCVPSQWRMIK